MTNSYEYPKKSYLVDGDMEYVHPGDYDAMVREKTMTILEVSDRDLMREAFRRGLIKKLEGNFSIGTEYLNRMGQIESSELLGDMKHRAWNNFYEHLEDGCLACTQMYENPQFFERNYKVEVYVTIHPDELKGKTR